VPPLARDHKGNVLEGRRGVHEAEFERGAVDEGLQRRARLPTRTHTIVLAVHRAMEVRRSHVRQHRAGLVLDDDDGPLPHVALPERRQRRVERRLRRPLHVAVDGRLHPRGRSSHGAAAGERAVPEGLHKVGRPKAAARLGERQRFGDRAIIRRTIDGPRGEHPAEDAIAASEQAVGVSAWIVERWTARQRRKGGGLGEREVRRRLVEVEPGGRARAADARAEGRAVRVLLEDAILVQRALNAYGERHLAELTPHRARVRPDHTRKLHGQGRGAGDHAPRPRRGYDRTHDRERIDSRVLPEAAVLRGDDRAR
jgi:hypothetical protein